MFRYTDANLILQLAKLVSMDFFSFGRYYIFEEFCGNGFNSDFVD